MAPVWDPARSNAPMPCAHRIREEPTSLGKILIFDWQTPDKTPFDSFRFETRAFRPFKKERKSSADVQGTDQYDFTLIVSERTREFVEQMYENIATYLGQSDALLGPEFHKWQVDFLRRNDDYMEKLREKKGKVSPQELNKWQEDYVVEFKNAAPENREQMRAAMVEKWRECCPFLQSERGEWAVARPSSNGAPDEVFVKATLFGDRDKPSTFDAAISRADTGKVLNAETELPGVFSVRGLLSPKPYFINRDVSAGSFGFRFEQLEIQASTKRKYYDLDSSDPQEKQDPDVVVPPEEEDRAPPPAFAGA